MHTSNIAAAKSHFSHLIDLVKQGQTVLITERNKPVATLQPVSPSSAAGLDALHASGLLTPPRAVLDVATFLSMPRASLDSKHSLAQAIVDERADSR